MVNGVLLLILNIYNKRFVVKKQKNLAKKICEGLLGVQEG